MMPPYCRQALDLLQVIRPLNGHRGSRRTCHVDFVPTAIASVSKVLSDPKAGVKITKASRADRRLGIISFLRNYTMEPKGMERQLLLGGKALRARHTSKCRWFLCRFLLSKVDLSVYQSELLDDSVMVGSNFPCKLLLCHMFTTCSLNLPFPRFPQSQLRPNVTSLVSRGWYFKGHLHKGFHPMKVMCDFP